MALRKNKNKKKEKQTDVFTHPVPARDDELVGRGHFGIYESAKKSELCVYIMKADVCVCLETGDLSYDVRGRDGFLGETRKDGCERESAWVNSRRENREWAKRVLCAEEARREAEGGPRRQHGAPQHPRPDAKPRPPSSPPSPQRVRCHPHRQ